MPARPVRTAAALLAGLSALAGCAHSAHQAKPLAPITPSASASSAKARVAPTAAPTQKNAAAFIRTYYAAVNRSAVLGRTKELKQYPTKYCSICRNYLDSIKYYEKRGQHLSGPPFELLSVVGEPLEGNITTVALTLTGPARKVLDKRGREVERLPARKRYYQSASVAWNRGRWHLVDIVDFS